MKTSLMKTALAWTAALYLSTGVGVAAQSNQAQDKGTVTIHLGHRAAEVTPEQKARQTQVNQLCHDAIVALHARSYAQAEADARQAIALDHYSPLAPETLAGALDGQGKTQEALQEYTTIVVKMGCRQTRVLLPYALLLLKTGQWAQAVAAYDQAMPQIPADAPHPLDGLRLLRASTRFSLDAPDPTGLATALHLAQGVMYNASGDFAHEDQSDLALFEYRKALELAPASALANYYLGYGLRKLGFKQQATAAFQKATDLATGDMKAVLQEAMKP